MSEIGKIIINVSFGDDIIQLKVNAETDDELQDMIDYAIEEFHDKTGKQIEGELNCQLGKSVLKIFQIILIGIYIIVLLLFYTYSCNQIQRGVILK